MGMEEEGPSGGAGRARGWAWKALVLIGGALLLKKLGKSTTRWDHSRIVAESINGDKFSREQANRDPAKYFNLRMRSCPVAEMVDGSRVLYYEQAFWRTPEKPFRQRFFMVKPCPKEMKCDVEVSTYAIRDFEEYKNFCDRPKDQRPQEGEAIADMAEHLTTIHLSRCARGKRCLYEGSTPPEGFPNSWNGAAYSTSQMVVHKNGEIHTCDRGYDENGNQVWGGEEPYEFKSVPAPALGFGDLFSPLKLPSTAPLERKLEESYAE